MQRRFDLMVWGMLACHGSHQKQFKLSGKWMESEDAILVLVGGIPGLPGGCGNDDIAKGLMVMEEYTDGVIYIHPSHVLKNP